MVKTLYKGVPQRRQALLNRDRTWLNKGDDTVSEYSDGQDGNVILTGTSTLTQDMLYKNLTVAAGAVLNTGGYKIFVKHRLLVIGTIQNIGTNATSVIKATASAEGTLEQGRDGGGNGSFGNGNGDNGSVNTFFIQIMGPGGKGGDSGARLGGTGDAGSGFDHGDAHEGRSLAYLSDFGSCTSSGDESGELMGGGCGGGGGASDGGGFGGGGGGGGGVIAIYARHMKVGDSGLITTPGGNGFAGASSEGAGGGGGSGGLVVILCDTYSGPDPVSPGGLGGSGADAADDGEDGSPGEFIRRFREFKV